MPITQYNMSLSRHETWMDVKLLFGILFLSLALHISELLHRTKIVKEIKITTETIHS